MCDDPQLLEALYQCYTSLMVFPAAAEEQRYVELCAFDLAFTAMQGKARGYLITPLGLKMAEERWGHRQR